MQSGIFFTRAPGESFRLEKCLGEPFATVTLIDHRGRLKILPRKMTHVRLDSAKGDKVVMGVCDPKKLAERCYTAHAAAAGWRGVDGLPIADWKDVPPRERIYWELAAGEVVAAICGE